MCVCVYVSVFVFFISLFSVESKGTLVLIFWKGTARGKAPIFIGFAHCATTPFNLCADLQREDVDSAWLPERRNDCARGRVVQWHDLGPASISSSSTTKDGPFVSKRGCCGRHAFLFYISHQHVVPDSEQERLVSQGSYVL